MIVSANKNSYAQDLSKYKLCCDPTALFNDTGCSRPADKAVMETVLCNQPQCQEGVLSTDGLYV